MSVPHDRPRFRLAKAYRVTFRVLASYLALRLRRPFLTHDGYERRLLDRHRINARRIERAIIELDGLFIKVGQLISILANFLPEAFRRELEGLQDSIPSRPIDHRRQRLRPFDRARARRAQWSLPGAVGSC